MLCGSQGQCSWTSGWKLENLLQLPADKQIISHLLNFVSGYCEILHHRFIEINFIVICILYLIPTKRIQSILKMMEIFKNMRIVPYYLFLCSGFALGWGPIPWLVMSEIFPHKVRGFASAVCVLTNWGLAFIVTKTFQDMMVSAHQDTINVFFIIWNKGWFFYIYFLEYLFFYNTDITLGKSFGFLLISLCRDQLKTKVVLGSQTNSSQRQHLWPSSLASPTKPRHSCINNCK